MIIKVWGRTVGYSYLLKKLQSMWRPKAFVDLVALNNDYFLVKFYSEEDYVFARDEGPWTILDHYMVVKEWTSNFDPVTDKIQKLIGWVRFPCLPIEYFDYGFLEKIIRKIRKPIWVDHNTGTASRGRFVRLCVEVDITKPLLAKFKLQKRIRTIEYEGIHLMCFGCGTYGHRQESCPKRMTEKVQKNGTSVEDNTDTGDGDETTIGGGLAVNGEVRQEAQIWKDRKINLENLKMGKITIEETWEIKMERR